MTLILDRDLDVVNTYQIINLKTFSENKMSQQIVVLFLLLFRFVDIKHLKSQLDVQNNKQ